MSMFFKRRTAHLTLASAMLLLACVGVARAYVDFADSGGGRWQGSVIAFLTGAISTPVSASNALPVSTGQSAPVTYGAVTTGSVSSSSATIVAAPGARLTKICNTTAVGGGNIWLSPGGGTVTAGQGDLAAAGNGCVEYSTPVANTNGNVISGVSDSGTATFSVLTGN